jgi:hypothetical protein
MYRSNPEKKNATYRSPIPAAISCSFVNVNTFDDPERNPEMTEITKYPTTSEIIRPTKINSFLIIISPSLLFIVFLVSRPASGGLCYSFSIFF